MSSREKLSLFAASKVRSIADSSYTFRNVTRSSITSSLPEDRSGIWRNDPQGAGMKSTQQVDLDYSLWTEHCFFNSAESKVNVTFDRLINHYPFDGNKTEMIQFMDQLTGYEKHVFDKFPKFLGSLAFDNSKNHYLTSEDKSGYLFPDISRNNLGERILGSAVSGGGTTIEFQVKIPAGETFNDSVIFQKLNSSKNHGISIFSSASLAASPTTNLVFALTSGSFSHATASMEVPKGDFQHVAFVYDNESTETLRLFLNGSQKATAVNEDFDRFDFQNSDFFIGSGSTQQFGKLDFMTPLSTFSGSIDEFRVWKHPRTLQQIRDFRKRNVFASDKLALYYRFNEPTGSYQSKNIALDMSGNGLHGQIINYTDSIRLDVGNTSSLAYERPEDNPVLFPDYPDLVTLNSRLLLSASRYDINNPNLITKLLPPHYFLEGQAEEGFEDVDANLGDNYGYHEDTIFPGGGGKIPTSQVLSSFLFIWASFFDEIKIYIDAFSKLETVEHVAANTIPSQFLESLANKYGFSLPNAFANTTPSQYADAEALALGETLSLQNLKKVQEMLWRRLMAELPHINREKGTVSSVKSMMRSLGIEPDNNFRIREFGGRKTSRFGLTRKEVRKSLNYIDFSVGTPFLTSSNLRAMRHEPGQPFGGPTPPDFTYQGGTIFFTVGGTTPTDTLFTSASWSWEGQYKMPNTLSSGSLQSLFRIETSGSSVAEPAIALNLLAVSGSNRLNRKNYLKLAFSGSEKSSLLISGSVPGLFDGGFWYINVNHSAGPVSSSFSVQASKTAGRTILASHTFSGSYENDTYTNNYLTNGASGTASATATIKAVETDKNSLGGTTIVITDSEGKTVTFTYDRFAASPSRQDSDEYKIGASGVSTAATHATAIAAALALAKTNGDLGLASAASDDEVSLTQDTSGPSGNTTISGTAVSAGEVTITQFSGGTTTGVWFAIGSSSNYRTDDSLGSARLLNADASGQSLDFTPFEGGLGTFRFWTKSLTKREKDEHALNPYSVGVNNPLVNYNFVKTADGRIDERSSALGASGSLPFGSWERLRFRNDVNQPITSSDAQGVLEIIDQSQNEKHAKITNFTAESSVFKRHFKSYSMFDPSFDIPTSINKVRIRSVQDPELAKDLYASSQPVYKLDARETINDDRRFSIEASLVQAINEDIVNLFADEEFLSDVLGAPENMFAVNYPRLERLADKYFERLTEKVNTKEFFEFFKWFDNNFSMLIEKLMPRTTNFLGVNFVIESHLLERSKFDYKQADVHIDLNSRLAASIEPEFLGIIKTENQ